MKKNYLRITAAILVILFSLLPLMSCDSSSTREEHYYEIKKIALDEDLLNNFSRLNHSDGKLYFIRNTFDKSLAPDFIAEDYIIDSAGNIDYSLSYMKYSEYYDSKTTTLCRINTDGSGFEELADFEVMQLADDERGIVSTNILTVSDSGDIWISIVTQIYSDGGDSGDRYIAKLNSSGKEEVCISLSELFPIYSDISVKSGAADKDGNLCFSDGQRIYVINNQLEPLFTIDESIDAITTNSKGEFFVAAYGKSNRSKISVKPLNLPEKSFGDEIVIDVTHPEMFNIYTGDGEADFYYMKDGKLYSYNLSKQTNTELYSLWE
jgi:hypothetical protein